MDRISEELTAYMEKVRAEGRKPDGDELDRIFERLRWACSDCRSLPIISSKDIEHFKWRNIPIAFECGGSLSFKYLGAHAFSMHYIGCGETGD